MSNTTTTKEAAAPEIKSAATPETTAKVAETVTELFEGALSNYEKTVKAGIELQKESIDSVKDLAAKFCTPEEFKAKIEALAADAVPSTRAKLDEAIYMFSKSISQALDLIEQAAEIGKAKSVTEAQAKVQTFLDSSLAIQRANFQTLVNANVKIVDAWKDLAAKFVPVAA